MTSLEQAQEIVRSLGVCGEALDGGHAVCVKPPGHPPPHGDSPTVSVTHDSKRVLPRRWTLWMDSTGQLRANEITPTFGGGGYVVVPEDSDEVPPWEPKWEPRP